MKKPTLIKTSCLVTLGFVLAAATFPAHAAKGLSIQPHPLKLTLSESGLKASYFIALTEAPTGDVSITLSEPTGQLTLQGNRGAAVLQFTPANFSKQQEVRVAAVNDSVPEGTKTVAIGYRVVAADQGYSTLEIPETPVEVIDDDQGDVFIHHTDGATRVREADGPDSYSIHLGLQPTSEVRITISTDRERVGQPAQLTAFPKTLTFTPSNYSVPQSVTVTAVNDKVAETPNDPSSRERLRHQVASTDSAYNLLPVQGDGFEVVIEDDDLEQVGVGVETTGDYTRVTEGGEGDSYTLVLRTQPATQVTVQVTAPDDLRVSPSAVVFTSEDYAIPQSITVTAYDDSTAEGTEVHEITHAARSTDLAYQDIAVDAVRVQVRDNDVHAVLLQESGGSTRVTEGGAKDSYTLVLSKRPTADVTVTTNGGTQLEIKPSALTFNAGNYSVPQTITVTAVDDRSVEPTMKQVIQHAVTTDDLAYASVAIDDVVATITDNDVRGVSFSKSSLAINEGGQDSYTVVLTARPDSDVEIEVSPEAPLQAAGSTPLIFTPDDFDQPQSVTIRMEDDDVAHGPRQAYIRHRLAGDEPYKEVVLEPMTASITDNDVAALVLEPADQAEGVTEGGAGRRYALRLATRPQADVVVSIASGNQLEVEPSSLTFTAADYAAPQFIDVAATDDPDAEGAHFGTLQLSSASDDSGYASHIINVEVAIADNDAVGLLLDVSPTFRVSEAGTTGRYALKLASRPAADVVIRIDAGEQLAASPAVLTFTSENYDVAQEIEVSAVDDSAAEGSHAGVLIHLAESADPAYHGLTAEVSVQIEDNDAGAKSKSGGGSLSGITLITLLLALVLVLCRAARRYKLG